MNWSAPGYHLVAEKLNRAIGFTFPAVARRSNEYRINAAMRECGFQSLDDFAESLTENDVPHQFVEEIVVCETYFQRELKSNEFVRTTVLPRLHKERRVGHELQVWSAGCSTGEEAYSLAALILTSDFASRFKVLASDISAKALVSATDGRYSKWSFRGVTDDFIRAHFTRDLGHWVVKEHLKTNISFAQLNLLELPNTQSPAVASMDLIYCRNVLIYFDKSTIAKIATELFKRLRPGGWLVTGASDPLLGSHAPFEVVQTDLGTFYRKPSEATKVPLSVKLSSCPTESQFDRLEEPLAKQPLAEIAIETAKETKTCSAIVMQTEPTTDVGSCFEEVATVLLHARTAFGAADWPEVIRLTASKIADEELVALCARSLSNCGRNQEAYTRLAEGVKDFPCSVELWFLHGMFCIERRQFADAQESFRNVIYLNPSVVPAHLYLGHVHHMSNNLRAAAKSFENVVGACERMDTLAQVPFGDGMTVETVREIALSRLAMLTALSQGATRNGQ
ncbi:MAG TPA: CheR family methyltransferase [Oculatellaceae cyanobacterium]